MRRASFPVFFIIFIVCLLCANLKAYMDPAMGRFLNRDPLGESGGLNLYAFCNNDPVNGIDYLGCADFRNHLMVGFDMLDQLGITLSDRELDSFLSGCIYTDMPDVPLNADGGVIPKASPLFVYLQTMEGYDFLNEKYGPRLKKLLGTARTARDVVNAVRNIDDNLGAMLVPIFAKKLAERAAKVAEKPRKRFGYWWNQTSYVGPILANTPCVNSTTTVQTHFGNLAYYHAMGYESTDTAESIQANLVAGTNARIAEFRKHMAAGNTSAAYFALGQSVHYLTDSWTPAHTMRSASGSIDRFYDYSIQDLNKHTARDNLSQYNPSAYSIAVSNGIFLYQNATSGGVFDSSSFYELSSGASVRVPIEMRKRAAVDIFWNGF